METCGNSAGCIRKARGTVCDVPVERLELTDPIVNVELDLDALRARLPIHLVVLFEVGVLEIDCCVEGASGANGLNREAVEAVLFTGAVAGKGRNMD